MKNIIVQLRQLKGIEFNPPCTTEQVDYLAAELNLAALPDDLRALYLDHDGMAFGAALPMRLMSHQEVIEFCTATEGMFSEHARFFWTDDNSNYTGLYVSGILEVKVCLLNHEEPDLSPCFRSVRTFYEALLDAIKPPRKGWYDMPTDYPLTRDYPETDAADLLLADQLIALYKTETDADKRREHAFSAMKLLPFLESEQLIPFLRDDDIWIPARACDMVGQRQFEPAVPELTMLMKRGRPNGDSASMDALGRIATPEAKLALLHIAPTLEYGKKWWVEGALQQCGYETKEVDEDYFYRESGSEDWLPL